MIIQNLIPFLCLLLPTYGLSKFPKQSSKPNNRNDKANRLEALQKSPPWLQPMPMGAGYPGYYSDDRQNPSGYNSDRSYDSLRNRQYQVAQDLERFQNRFVSPYGRDDVIGGTTFYSPSESYKETREARFPTSRRHHSSRIKAPTAKPRQSYGPYGPYGADDVDFDESAVHDSEKEQNTNFGNDAVNEDAGWDMEPDMASGPEKDINGILPQMSGPNMPDGFGDTYEDDAGQGASNGNLERDQKSGNQGRSLDYSKIPRAKFGKGGEPKKYPSMLPEYKPAGTRFGPSEDLDYETGPGQYGTSNQRMGGNDGSNRFGGGNFENQGPPNAGRNLESLRNPQKPAGYQEEDVDNFGFSPKQPGLNGFDNDPYGVSPDQEEMNPFSQGQPQPGRKPLSSQGRPVGGKNHGFHQQTNYFGSPKTDMHPQEPGMGGSEPVAEISPLSSADEHRLGLTMLAPIGTGDYFPEDMEGTGSSSQGFGNSYGGGAGKIGRSRRHVGRTSGFNVQPGRRSSKLVGKTEARYGQFVGHGNTKQRHGKLMGQPLYGNQMPNLKIGYVD